MARSTLSDHLQVFPFWLTDAAPISSLAQPLFQPLSGFSAVTMPEITLDADSITEGNQMLRKKVVASGEVSNMTLTRGATSNDQDFYRWIQGSIRGTPRGSGNLVGGPTFRRDLLLIHFFVRSPISAEATALITGAVVTGISLAAGFVSALGANNLADAAGAGANLTSTAISGVQGLQGAVGARISEVAVRLPARAWLLKGCLPIRYKPGSDFEASSGDVSLMELDIAVEDFDEVTLLL